MSVFDDGIDDPSMEEVRAEIDRLMGDTSVPHDETRERMVAIREYVQENINALDDDDY